MIRLFGVSLLAAVLLAALPGCGQLNPTASSGLVIPPKNDDSGRESDDETSETTTKQEPGFRLVFLSTRPITDVEANLKLIVQDRNESFEVVTESVPQTFSDNDVVNHVRLLEDGESVVYTKLSNGDALPKLYKFEFSTGTETMIFEGDPETFTFNIEAHRFSYCFLICPSALHPIGLSDDGSRSASLVGRIYVDPIGGSSYSWHEFAVKIGNADSQTLRPTRRWATEPVYRPGTNDIYYVTFEILGVHELYKADSDDLENITLLLSSSDKRMSTPGFLPDGSKFLISRQNNNATGPENLYLIDANGENEEEVTSSGTDIRNYSPDIMGITITTEN